jgi:hypothetical protein
MHKVVEVGRHSVSTSVLHGRGWLASSLVALPREKSPGIHWIRGWVRPRALLDTMEEKQISFSSQEINSDSLVIEPMA